MWWRPDKDQQLDDELLAHFAIEVKQRIESGQSPEEAELAARLQFGNVALIKEVTRDMWGNNWLETLAQDLKYAFRTMRKTPAFTAIAVLTLALGIGASAAVFSVVNGILLRPLAYPEPDRIAMLWRLAPISAALGGEEFPWGKFDFSMFRDQSKSFESLGALQPDNFNLTGSGEPLSLDGMRASAGFFPALGIAPSLGRVFTADEDRPGHEHVIVLSDRLWHEHFSADPSILGRSVQLSGFSYLVIGVMPPGFSFPRGGELPAYLEFPREAQLWIPLAIEPSQRQGPSEMAVVGRLRPNMSLAQAQADLDVFGYNFERLFPASKAWTRSKSVPLKKQVVGDTERPLLLLLGAVALVLLMACANVAGLLLTRSLARRRELMLRAALGAGFGRLVRQLLTESLLLAATGGLIGIALGEAGILFVKKFGPANLPRLQEVSLDLPVFAFCAAITLFTGLLFGLAPALGAARQDLSDSLRYGHRIAGSDLSPKLRNLLLVGQIALALVLVVATGLLTRTFYSMLASDGGFKVEHVLTFEISLAPVAYPDPLKMAQLYRRVLDAAQAIPGVESAGLAKAVPLGGEPDGTSIRIAGHVAKPNETLYAGYMVSSPGYFATVRTPLLRGRDFLPSDTLDSPPVTIVNRAMADAMWPGQDAMGQQVAPAGTLYPLCSVIGIVPNVKQGSLREKPVPQMYVPVSQHIARPWPPIQTMQVALRTIADPAQITTAARQAIHSVDPGLPIAKVATLTELVDQSLTQPRFAMLLLAAFGALALLLASIGMYGVISYSVTQRTQEIGVRMALGAERSNVFRMILAQGMRLAGAGIGLGLFAALALTRTMSAFLYGVRPADPLTFGTVSLLLILVALLACYVPARQATRVNPVVALRHE
jgi:predicted permease